MAGLGTTRVSVRRRSGAERWRVPGGVVVRRRLQVFSRGRGDLLFEVAVCRRAVERLGRGSRDSVLRGRAKAEEEVPGGEVPGKTGSC